MPLGQRDLRALALIDTPRRFPAGINEPRRTQRKRSKTALQRIEDGLQKTPLTASPTEVVLSAGRVSKPNFFLVQNNSKGIILALPFEAHTIQVNITKKGYLNRFKVADVDPVTFREWGVRNIGTLSQIAWFAYDHGRYRERMVATNLVRELEIDLDKYTGWAFR